MQRALAPEIMDDTEMPDQIWEHFHQELTAIHHILRNIRAIENAIDHDALPVRRVLDLGCNVIRKALQGGLGSFSIHVAPFWIRQTVDIRFY